MNISDIIIPDDLLADIKVFCELLDTHERIYEIILNEEFAELIKPYSRKVASGEYSTFAETELFLYMVCTKHHPDIIITEDNIDWLNHYHDSEEFDEWLENKFESTNDNIFKYRSTLFWLREAYYLHNANDCLNTMTLTELLSDITYLARWCHIKSAQVLYKSKGQRSEIKYLDQFFLPTLIASVLPEFEDVLWTGNNMLTKTEFWLWEFREENIWLDIVNPDIVFEDIDGANKIGECLIFLLEDRLIRFNVWVNATVYKKDFPCYEILEFKDNHHMEDLDLPATPDGFLLLKMMEI